MDVVGSEIGQKMRSAIKAKLTELGCYVDDELPDYVMVMVANKRTRSQMDDDLQLFLGDNTELFVNWLHQVLKKLQEVTITAPLEAEKSKEKTKEKKSKDREKSKLKKLESGKEKKLKKKDKDKDKSHKKKDKGEKKSHKKKSKHHEMIRPNIPPLLMNIEKESEPSITDVFAGQILKNHGVILDSPKDQIVVDIKPVVTESKRPIRPIIDPATIIQPDVEVIEPITTQTPAIEEPVITQIEDQDEPVTEPAPREEQIKEINEIEAKIQGLKQKLTEQLDSMSDDEDFLNIRTEAEELMNDFAEDVFQEISAQAPAVTPPRNKSPIPPKQTVPMPIIEPKLPPEPEVLPQIELNLPKRPIRERLGVKSVSDIERLEVARKVPEARKFTEVKEKEDDRHTESPERFTPEREPDFWPKSRSAKSRLGDVPETSKRRNSDDSDKSDERKKISSKPSSRDRPRGCASVVVVRPRPRVSSASTLLLRAVADAHKSLLTIPPKVSSEPQQVKRAMVLPMRRCVDPQKIVIQVPGDETDPDESDRNYKMLSDTDGKEEYVPALLTKKIHNTDYVPSRRPERTSSRRDDTLIIETINIHNTTVDKDKDTQFIVTMDGFNPNAFLAKKLQTEGLLNEEEELTSKPKETTSVLRIKETVSKKKDENDNKNRETAEKGNGNIEESGSSAKVVKTETAMEIDDTNKDEHTQVKTIALQNKRLSNTSEESDTQIIIKQENSRTENKKHYDNENRKSYENDNRKSYENDNRKSYENENRKSYGIENRKSFEAEKRKSCEFEKGKSSDDSESSDNIKSKKRKASPIVFDVKKDRPKEKERARTESASSDNQVVVTTAAAKKYDSVPPLSTSERKQVWCRTFPLCPFGAACAFQHPRCKFAAACTRRACVYSHPARLAGATVASHVVPAANFKSITSSALPSICKYYPNCANPTCHFYHPKPCRYGKACVNKLECNFYHSDLATNKFRYPV